MADANRFNIDVSDKVANMFPTPVIGYHWPDSDALNDALAAMIFEREKNSPGVTASNAGGWQSTDDLLSWNEPCVQELKGRIEGMLLSVLRHMNADPENRNYGRFRIDCWANINRAGQYNAIHSHPNALWSGVYYVKTGEPDRSTPYAGKIEIIDPREASNFIQTYKTVFDQKCIINNDPGFMLMFPSWVKHMVHPHNGDEPRISIAFNALAIGA